MNIGRISTPVLLSFLIIMFITVIGCEKKSATSVISGTVSGDVKKGVTINLTGAATASTTTDTSGNYSFSNQENGNYTVTPYLDGYTFSPTSTNVAVSGASVTGINFTSTHSGYGISGTVTGAVAANVTLTLSDLNLTTTTTDSDGNYTLRSTDIGNNTYIVKPYLAGYKFNPYNQSVPVGNASVTGINFVSSSVYTAAGSATGTYTWDPTTPTGGELTITWTPETVPCNWPQAGTDAESSVTITNYTMTWPNTIQWPSDEIAWLGMMIWTRTKGTANDPAGVWTAYDQSGNKYTATFTATNATTGSISLAENIVACAYTRSEIISGDYHVSLSYQDPQPPKAISVSVTGPGISGSQILTYNNAAGEWNINGTRPGGVIDLTSFLQTPPYTYTFTVIISDPDNKWDERSCFVDWPTFPNPFYNKDPLTKILTFYWTGVTDALGYVVQVKDSNYNLMWESPETSGNSINYGSTPAAVLTSGDTYYLYVQVRGTSYCANGTSYAEVSFIAP
jgi:hypothetical protein